MRQDGVRQPPDDISYEPVAWRPPILRRLRQDFFACGEFNPDAYQLCLILAWMIQDGNGFFLGGVQRQQQARSYRTFAFILIKSRNNYIPACQNISIMLIAFGFL
jgi:hypothetical protein